MEQSEESATDLQTSPITAFRNIQTKLETNLLNMSGPEAVKVIIRCRPMNQREKSLKSKVRYSIQKMLDIHI